MARHLFIVSRDHPWLYTYLLERFEGDTNVHVILDRRARERRAGGWTQGWSREDRRTRERRRAVPAEEDLGRRSHYIVEL
jgi:hypothetical protein